MRKYTPRVVTGTCNCTIDNMEGGSTDRVQTVLRGTIRRTIRHRNHKPSARQARTCLYCVWCKPGLRSGHGLRHRKRWALHSAIRYDTPYQPNPGDTVLVLSEHCMCECDTDTGRHVFACTVFGVNLVSGADMGWDVDRRGICTLPFHSGPGINPQLQLATPLKVFCRRAG